MKRDPAFPDWSQAVPLLRQSQEEEQKQISC